VAAVASLADAYSGAYTRFRNLYPSIRELT